MKITVINGTNRIDNRSQEISRKTVEVASGHEVGLVDLTNFSDLFRGKYLEFDSLSSGQKEDIDSMIESNILIFVVPTYHSGIPASLKNFFEMIKIPEAYDGKIIGLMASNSKNQDKGARMAVQVINGMLAYRRANSFIAPIIPTINYDEIDEERIDKFITYLCKFRFGISTS